MSFFEIVVIACGLAMDAAAVSLAAAAAGFVQDVRSSCRLAFHFGLFQFLMPVLGWLAGVNFAASFATFDHWIAFGLLTFVGGRMLWNGFSQEQEEESIANDPSRGLTLVLLSLATSIDALAIGLSLSMLEVTIWYPAAMIGIITALLSALAIMIGKKVGTKAGKRMEIFGGVILVVIGTRILITHLL
ncbi:MAG: putative Mn2+ efflux pump MntP [Candidatus Electronema aureum]|uniref:Putative manganese efflux pump MntP n=1 Tax=Candidatus Electronema aureum TaxID=2005002 RepID=A0A521FYH6_9BACT|nr:MAG: putative Mn2+ efflux pump MntP [Candidatus Electronema aureum]